MAEPGKRVGLFVTCLVDLIRPSIGFAAAKLLEDAGCTVEVPRQTCCGQPAFNSGDRRNARAIAEQVIDAFAQYDYVVAPSGSCAGMLKLHYPELFHGDPNWLPRADAVAAAFAAFFSTMALEMSGYLTQKVPPKPQHTSASRISLRVSPRTVPSSRRGCTRTPSSRRPEHESW